jgi:hypothetical protein
MIFCIVGALLCGGIQHVPGPVAYAPQPSPVVWNYAAYYSVPVLTSQLGDTLPVDLPQNLNRQGSF